MNALVKPPAPYRVGDVLYGDDQRVANFVKALIAGLEKANWETYTALGVLEGDELVGGVVFHNFRPMAGDLEITAAFTTPAWCKKATYRRLLAYPYFQLAAKRCTARTAESNVKARKFLGQMGFVVEGVARRGYSPDEDMILYGVLKEELNFRME